MEDLLGQGLISFKPQDGQGALSNDIIVGQYLLPQGEQLCKTPL
ncbi:MAG TPA: hypothetical protein V6C84_16195 [Coleofasciculaceae cyanobacterium]